MSTPILPIKAFAAELGVRRETLGEIVRLHGVATVPVPHSPNSKGLDGAAQQQVRKLLGFDKPRPRRKPETAAAN